MGQMIALLGPKHRGNGVQFILNDTKLSHDFCPIGPGGANQLLGRVIVGQA